MMLVMILLADDVVILLADDVVILLAYDVGDDTTCCHDDVGDCMQVRARLVPIAAIRYPCPQKG